MRISDWSSDVCSSDLPSEMRGHISRIPVEGTGFHQHGRSSIGSQHAPYRHVYEKHAQGHVLAPVLTWPAVVGVAQQQGGQRLSRGLAARKSTSLNSST